MKYLLLLLLCLALTGCAREEAPVRPETQPGTTASGPAAEPETRPAEPAEPASEGNFVCLDRFPELSWELQYAVPDNFTGETVYRFDTPWLRWGTARKLAQANADLMALGYRLRIWDAFRPLSAQWELWYACPDPRYVSNPDTGGTPHCRGNTVDVTLVTLAGEPVEMPTAFDDFTALADRDYTDCTLEAAKNAILLETVMENHGFSGYYREWWHFVDDVDYPVEEVFDPTAVSRWLVRPGGCLLRQAPQEGAKALAELSGGDAVTLLGWTGDSCMVECGGQQGFVPAACLTPE